MAYQLGSAVTPFGEAGLQNLIAGEQANRAMGQQAMQQQQQLALGQQSLEQEQAAMGQRQLQFEQAMAQERAITQQQFQNASALARQQNEFNAAQNDAIMKWQQAQTSQLKKFQLQLEMLDAKREEALSAGMVDAARQIADERAEIKRAHAKKAQQIALSGRMVGQSKEAIERMLNGYEAQLGRVVNTEQRNQELGKRFVDNLVGAMDAEEKKVNVDQLTAFLTRQRAEESLSPSSYFTAPSFTELERQVNAGDAPGIEFLTLAPTMYGRLRAVDPSSTSDFSAVVGEMDASTMTNALKGRISRGVMKTLRDMGIKDFDEDAAQRLVEGALEGKTQPQLAGLVERSRVPASTLKVLMGAAADRFLESETNESWSRLNQGEASAIDASGGQNSLRREGFRKKKEAFRTMGKMLRTAANSFPGMDLDEITAGIEAVKAMRQSGQYSPLVERSADAAGLGPQLSDLRNLYQQLPAAKQALAQESIGLGDLAEEEAIAGEMAPVRLMGAQRSALGERAKELQKLLEGYQ